jgi:uncharacterized Zn finger protein
MAESKVSNQVREKGIRLFRKGCVKRELDTDKRIHFSVQGESDKHSVIFDRSKASWSCDCRFNSMKGKECSHIYACRLAMK